MSWYVELWSENDDDELRLSIYVTSLLLQDSQISYKTWSFDVLNFLYNLEESFLVHIYHCTFSRESFIVYCFFSPFWKVFLFLEWFYDTLWNLFYYHRDVSNLPGETQILRNPIYLLLLICLFPPNLLWEDIQVMYFTMGDYLG